MGAILAGVISGANAIASLYTAYKQNKMLKSLVPSTYIDPSTLRNKSMANTMVNSTQYAGQDIDRLNLNRNMTNSIGGLNRTVSNGGDILNFAGSALAQKNNAEMALLSRFQNYHNNSLAQLMNANRAVGAQERENMNKYYAAKSALIGAKNQNIANAFGGGAASAAMFAIGNKGSSTNENSKDSGDSGLSGLMSLLN